MQESNAATDEIQRLAKRSRVLGLPQRQDITPRARMLLSQADAEKRLLSTDEINELCHTSGADPQALIALQREAQNLVNETKAYLLDQHPGLVKPGGALYPEHRSEACWRDCYHFLRVSCYAVAVLQPQLCDQEGMANLGRLYALMGVPIDALLMALRELRRLAAINYSPIAPEQDIRTLDGAIEELINNIEHYRVTSC